MKAIFIIITSLLISFKLLAGGCTPPIVVSQPSNAVVCENGNTFFTISATGPSVIFQWQVDQGAGFIDLSNVAPYSGVNTATLNITTVPLSLDNAIYRCFVTNGCVPNDTSDDASLKVNLAPNISTQPSNAFVCEGAIGSFSLITGGTGLSYQWQVNDGSGFVNVPAAPPYSGDTTGALYITGVSLSFNGYTFQCIVTGVCSPSVTSSVVTLTVNELPSVDVQPAFAETCENDDASLSITASGTGLTYQWQENQGSGYVNLISSSTYLGVNTNILIINSATLSMNGYFYQCIVSGACIPSDTTYEIPLIVHPAYTLFTNATICQGDTIVFGSSSLTAPGFYSNMLSSVYGCDSLVYLSLNVNSAFFTTTASTICAGDSVSLGGTYQSTAGMYTFVLSAVTGCDSTIEHTLSVNPSYSFAQTTTICTGDSTLIFGTYEMIDSVYTDNYSTFLGCDSIYTHQLIVRPNYNVALNANICEGDSALIGGTYESVAGPYVNNYVSLYGCDSVVTTLLAVHPNDSISQSIAICSYDSIFLAGAFQNTAGVYTDNLSSSFGCDSVVTTTLSINIAPSVVFDQVVVICDTSTAFIITGGSPIGGVYSGTGVSTGIFSPSVAGIGAHNITYSYTDSLGCSDVQTSSIVVTACTGINDLSVETDFNIYPNPFSDVLTISSTSNSEIELSFVNILGEQVYSARINKGKTEIDLSEITAGIYFVQVATSEKTITKKIIKK